MSEIIFDDKSTTNIKFGSLPLDRSLDELLNSGILLVKKPRGPTSHQLTAWVRNILGIKKIGHGGTFCLLYTSPSPRDRTRSRMPSSA